MYKFLIATAMICSPVYAADIPTIMPKSRPIITSILPESKSIFEYSFSSGGMYSTKDRVAYGVISPKIVYEDLGVFGEYGYSRGDRQFVSGGISYDFKLPYGVYITPEMKGGYHWNHGAFISPGVKLTKSLTEQLSVYGQYDFVQYRRKENDSQFQVGVKVDF